MSLKKIIEYLESIKLTGSSMFNEEQLSTIKGAIKRFYEVQ